MTKRERLEDLGVIYSRLDDLITEFDYDFPYFEAKHKYESFAHDMAVDDNLYRLHSKLRYLIKKLEEIRSVALGDVDYV